MMHDREKVIKNFEDFVISFSKRDNTYYKSLFNSVLAMLQEQEERIKKRDESVEKAQEEIKWLRKMLKEQENASKRNPVIVCPHCGKRVK